MMRGDWAAVAGWISFGVLALCSISPLASAQDLTIASTHTGTFLLGQTNAYYLLRVKNVGKAPTSGYVSATEDAPAGLAIVSMHGEGWTCTANSCGRSDSLAAGASYPAIMALASVAPTAGSSLTNQATVAGGGDTNAGNNTASDVTAVAANGYPVAWGCDGSGQATVPAGLSGVVAIAAGRLHSLALKSDGTVVGWGDNSGEPPAGLSGVVAIVAGAYHSLALKSDGTVVGWGSYGMDPHELAGLSGIVGLAAGEADSIVLKSNGGVVAWGPFGAGRGIWVSGISGVVGVAQGLYHSLVLKGDGTVFAWGNNIGGQMNVPAGLSNVVVIAAGMYHSLALRSDGTVVAWGNNTDGRMTPPAGLSDVVRIAAGGIQNLALKGDGTVVAWGSNTCGQTTLPAELSNGIAVAAGDQHSLSVLSAAPATIPVTFMRSPLSGWSTIIVDGTSYTIGTSRVLLQWTPGSTHTIGTTSPVAIDANSQYLFSSWSDGGAITHAVAPTAATTFTANFKGPLPVRRGSTAPPVPSKWPLRPPLEIPPPHSPVSSPTP